MATYVDRSGPTTSTQMNMANNSLLMETFEAKVARFERLALRLFNVSNCIVNLGNLPTRFDPAERSMSSLEAMFCQNFLLVSDLFVVNDTLANAEISQHEFVLGAPYIRMYVAYPIKDASNNVIGNISLIDYKAREFDDESRLLLADLAVLIEREVALISLHQSQMELIKQNRNLKRDSLVDPVLGTWNKLAIIRSLKIEMARCSRAEKPLSLIFSTLDQMLHIREKHGVAFGDMAMIRVVSRIRSCIRPFDSLGRYGGDVFLIVLPGASHLVATAVAERIRMAVMSHPDNVDGELLSLTASAGIVSTDMFPNAEPELLISLAERALLSAKSAGSNHVAQATSDLPDIII